MQKNWVSEFLLHASEMCPHIYQLHKFITTAYDCWQLVADVAKEKLLFRPERRMTGSAAIDELLHEVSQFQLLPCE